MRARVPSPREHVRSHLPEKSEETKNIPRPYKLRRFYTPDEVSVHNTSDDCWFSFFGQVFDLTLLIKENYQDVACDPLVLVAGQDITHWFDP
jgi:cytochrome b involved in lipid metabolism